MRLTFRVVKHVHLCCREKNLVNVYVLRKRSLFFAFVQQFGTGSMFSCLSVGNTSFESSKLQTMTCCFLFHVGSRSGWQLWPSLLSGDYNMPEFLFPHTLTLTCPSRRILSCKIKLRQLFIFQVNCYCYSENISCKAKRQCLLTREVSRCCLLALQGSNDLRIAIFMFLLSNLTTDLWW